MANTWSAGQYRRAAEAHKRVCDYMLENIENADDKQSSKIYFEIVYLSFYVLECAMKWAILNKLGHSHSKEFSNQELKDLENDSGDKRNLWRHKITGQTGLYQYIVDEGVIPPSPTYTFIGTLHRFDDNGEWVVMRYAIGEKKERPTKQEVEDYYNNTLLPIFNQLIR